MDQVYSSSPGNNTMVRAAMRDVVGNLENVLGELKTVVGDLRILVSQIDVVTDKINNEKKEVKVGSPERRRSASFLDTTRIKRNSSSSVRHSVSESCDILKRHKELQLLGPPSDFIKPKFPEPEIKILKPKSSKISSLSGSHSQSFESLQRLAVPANMQKPSSREEVWYEGVGKYLNQSNKTSKDQMSCSESSKKSSNNIPLQKPTSALIHYSSFKNDDSSTPSSSQGHGTLSSCSSLHPFTTHCSPCSPNTNPAGGEYCGVYERELDLRLELEFDDDLECYTGIDDGDTLDLQSYRLALVRKDHNTNPCISLVPESNSTQHHHSNTRIMKDHAVSDTDSDILNDNVIHGMSMSQLSDLSSGCTSSNYGTYDTWEDTDSADLHNQNNN